MVCENRANFARISLLRRVYARAGVRYPPHTPCAVSVNRHKLDRFALFQIEHAPNLCDCGFRELSLPLGQPRAFRVEPQGAFLFRGELFHSGANEDYLHKLVPIAFHHPVPPPHGEILPPTGRNLPQGHEQRECLPRVVGTGRRGFSRCGLPKR